MTLKNKPNKGLGRGLSAIFDIEETADNTPTNGICDIDIDMIEANINQPRKHFDDEHLLELSRSIEMLGLVQPITVRRNVDSKGYTIVSGERRYRAAKLAGLTKLPAYVRDVDDNVMLEMALVENIQRQDLNAMEVAVSLQRLVEECDITQESLADRVGKKRSTVSNYIRLLKLPAQVQLAIKNGDISMGHARALITIESYDAILLLLDKIISGALSVRQTEQMIKKLSEQNIEEKKNDDNIEYPIAYSRLVEKLETILGNDISIKSNAKGKGKIVIGFKNEKEIDNILSKLDSLMK